MITSYSLSTICTVFLVYTKVVSARPTFEGAPSAEEAYYPPEEHRINNFKKTVLDKLGYQNIPDISQANLTIGERREMVKMYRQHLESLGGSLDLNEKGVHTEESLAITSFYPTEFEMRKNSHHGIALRFHFNIQLSPMQDPFKDISIHSAQLKFNNVVKLGKKQKSSTMRINVFQLRNNSTNGIKKWEYVSSKTIARSEFKQASIDISNVVRQWTDNDGKGELKVTFHTYSNSKNETHIDTDLKRTELEVAYKEHHILERVKRHEDTNECGGRKKDKRCCRQKQWISFKDIGWDSWVIAPEGYHSYFCNGTCPYRYKLANTFAGIKSSLHRKKPKIIPAPCCTATKFSPLTILHYDEYGIMTFTHHPDMIVEECMCS